MNILAFQVEILKSVSTFILSVFKDSDLPTLEAPITEKQKVVVENILTLSGQLERLENEYGLNNAEKPDKSKLN